jgi:hypothetical protein
MVKNYLKKWVFTVYIFRYELNSKFNHQPSVLESGF